MNHPAKAFRNPLRQRVAFASALALIAFGSTAADAPPANITVAGSTITATFKQEGVPVNTMFKQFSGRIEECGRGVGDTGSPDHELRHG
jgi:uroporphyrinogen-III synthase